MNKHIYNEFEYDLKEDLLKNHSNIYCYTFERIFDLDQKEIGKKFMYKSYSQEEISFFDQEKQEQKIIALKIELQALDFKTTKQVEAFLVGNDLPYNQEEFKQIVDHKQLLRDQINDLEGS
jgi:hypothetical protein